MQVNEMKHSRVLCFPHRVTMGAMLRFKRETGRDFSEVGEKDIEALVVFMWCCTVSACKADGVDFGLSLEDYADMAEPSDVRAFYGEMSASSGEDVSPGEKKT